MMMLRLLYFATAIISVWSATEYPPYIVTSPQRTVVFEQFNSFQLPCEADGSPTPTYKWTFNEKEFNPAGTDGDVAMKRDSGSLLFNKPKSAYQGYYKCFADNGLGIAVADTTLMLNASLGSFTRRRQERNVQQGDGLRIVCNKPVSFPDATINWNKKSLEGVFTIVDYNDRVAIDNDGGLHFANLLPSDSGEYECSAYNSKLAKSTASGIYKITVSQGTPTQRQPVKSWTSPTTLTFLRGRPASLKCIFTGNPTPNVIWSRTDNGRDVGQRRSYGLELYFDSIDYEDEGSYQCKGHNTAATLPETSTVEVRVESHPVWIEQPKSVTRSENETHTFYCSGESKPQPRPIMWFKNGVAITGNTDHIIIGEGPQGASTSLTIKNIVKSDTCCFQCNITNDLGWIHKSFYLNVQDEMPTIVDFDVGPFKWAATRTYNLTCKVFGAPTPLISWTKGGQPLTGGRFFTYDDGTLGIRDVGITDVGNYECKAVNRLGVASRTTTVAVRRPTQIQQAPEDLTVTAETQAKFVCTALTDPDEALNLRILWKKNGNPIDYTASTRMFMNVQDNSLQIASPTALDSGTYTCSASNGIDVAEASATLRVQDRPEHPASVTIQACSGLIATVKWSPGANNNAPLLNFIVQYEVEKIASTWFTAEDKVGPKTTQIDIDLKPDNKYSFRVLSENKIGISDHSSTTSDTCDTTPGAPLVNPSGVRTLDEGSTKLVITWQPLTPIDFGGETFEYIARWRKKGDNRCYLSGKESLPWCSEPKPALDGTQGKPGELNLVEYKVERIDEPTYQAYEIQVTCRNKVGSPPNPEIFPGYSGEGDPTQMVQGFSVAKINGTDQVFADNATFTWQQVDESDDATNGFFRGYRISYTKTSSLHGNVDEEDTFFATRSIYIILRDVKFEGKEMHERPLETNDFGAVEADGKVTVTVTNIPSFSELEFTISVINKRRSGRNTDALVVTTLEGLPGPVGDLRITENGPTHVKLTWSTPIEPNGYLTKYMVAYKTIDGLKLGPLQFPEQRYRNFYSGEEQVTTKVTGLKPLQMYRFYVWAFTIAGQGSEYFIDDSTVAAGYPGAPTIAVEHLKHSNNTLKVMWTPSPVGVPANVFYVQYKQESAIDQWQRTGWETNNNFIEMNAFEDGWRYEVRVVASNGGIYETASSSVNVYPSSESRSATEAKEVFSSAWFIGLLILLLLLALVFVIVFIIHQNRGGVYTNHFQADEAERLRPYEESTFDEKSARGTESRVYQPETPVSEKFKGPPAGDEYMQDDPSRYGEEGSFIGQYREKQELPSIPKGVRQEPYQPPSRFRPPPSEAMYSSSRPQPAPAPRGSQSSQQERRPPPRQTPRSYQPPHGDYQPSNDYSSDTRYRTVTHDEDDEPSGTQTVV